jgi:hypothetical protein
MGIDFIYSDGTQKSTGSSDYDGQLRGQTTLDLKDKRMFQVDSYCDATSDFIRFCSLTNNGTKTCIENEGESDYTPDMFVCLNNMNIQSYVGNYFSYDGWDCLLNLGVNVITTSKIDTSCSDKQVYIPLIREQTGVKEISNFTAPVTTNQINKLANLTVYYSKECIMGMDFVFSDGTKVKTGSSDYDGQLRGQTTLDLKDKRMFQVDSYCDATSDFIRFCSLTNNGTKTCIDTGNVGKLANMFVCMNNLSIYSYSGNYFSYNNGWYCLSNLGVNVIATSEIDISCSVKEAYVPLIREQTNVTAISSFNQPVTTNNNNILTNFTVYYSIKCIMGIDFLYNDGTKVSTGLSTYGGQLSGQTTLELTLKRMFEVDSYFNETLNFIRFCSVTNNGTKKCIDSEVNLVSEPNMFVCMNYMNIKSFVGTYIISMGWYCLSNFGANVITTSGIDTTC